MDIMDTAIVVHSMGMDMIIPVIVRMDTTAHRGSHFRSDPVMDTATVAADTGGKPKPAVGSRGIEVTLIL